MPNTQLLRPHDTAADGIIQDAAFISIIALEWASTVDMLGTASKAKLPTADCLVRGTFEDELIQQAVGKS